MTSARIHEFCEKWNTSKGCYDNSRRNPKSITESSIALHLYKHHFCLIWNSNDNSFKKNKRRVKNTLYCCAHCHICEIFKVFFIKVDFKPKKVQCQINNGVIFHLKTFSTDKCVPDSVGL